MGRAGAQQNGSFSDLFFLSQLRGQVPRAQRAGIRFHALLSPVPKFLVILEQQVPIFHSCTHKVCPHSCQNRQGSPGGLLCVHCAS